MVIMPIINVLDASHVAKAVGCKIEEMDKELILGLILQSSKISAEDKARLKLRGESFLEDMVGRQEWALYEVNSR